jgi:hypothetical protein
MCHPSKESMRLPPASNGAEESMQSVNRWGNALTLWLKECDGIAGGVVSQNLLLPLPLTMSFSLSSPAFRRLSPAPLLHSTPL